MDRKDNKEIIHGLPLIPPQDDELFCLTDTEDSSSSSNCHIFDNRPLVMELHGVQKDELPDNPLPEVKTRKLLKKKRKPEQDQSAASLTSSSTSSMVPPGPEKQEEFYDAHESYYDFPENQASATGLGSIAIVASQQNNPEVKKAPETTALSDATTTAAATQEIATSQTPITSAVTKPIHPTPK